MQIGNQQEAHVSADLGNDGSKRSANLTRIHPSHEFTGCHRFAVSAPFAALNVVNKKGTISCVNRFFDAVRFARRNRDRTVTKRRLSAADRSSDAVLFLQRNADGTQTESKMHFDLHGSPPRSEEALQNARRWFGNRPFGTAGETPMTKKSTDPFMSGLWNALVADDLGAAGHRTVWDETPVRIRNRFIAAVRQVLQSGAAFQASAMDFPAAEKSPPRIAKKAKGKRSDPRELQLPLMSSIGAGENPAKKGR